MFCIQVRLSPHLTLTTFPLKREEEGESSDKQFDELPLAMCVCVCPPTCTNKSTFIASSSPSYRVYPVSLLVFISLTLVCFTSALSLSH